MTAFLLPFSILISFPSGLWAMLTCNQLSTEQGTRDGSIWRRWLPLSPDPRLDTAVAVLILMLVPCVDFLAFFDSSSVQPRELASYLQLALHLGHYSLLAVQAFDLQWSGPSVFCLISSLVVSPISSMAWWSKHWVPCFLASQHWLLHSRSRFPCPCYQNHFLSLCIFNSLSHKLANGSDTVLNAVTLPWGWGKNLDIDGYVGYLAEDDWAAQITGCTRLNSMVWVEEVTGSRYEVRLYLNHPEAPWGYLSV